MSKKLEKHFGSKPVVWVAAWGLSKLRKRAGRFPGGIEGEARWYDAWYDRVMSEPMVDKLADLGVNLVSLPFSLGGSDRAETSEQDDFERMTRLLHARGMVSLPYLQYQNILQEDFTFPETTWGVRLDGSPKQFAYWRRTVCQSTPPFIAYMKGRISDAVNRGADGIWIDNTHLAPCRCEDCQTRFKTWLTQNRAELLAELYLDDFERIEMPPTVQATFDPIVRALIDFNVQRNLEVLQTLKAHLEACNPDGLFASNPGLYRGDSTTMLYGHGIDFRAMVGLHDLMYLENKFFPLEAEGQTTGNYHGFISCAACETLAIPGAWKLDTFDSTDGEIGAHTSGFPKTREEIRRALFEGAAFGGALGMLWAIRARPEQMCGSPDDLMTTYLEHPDIEPVTRETLAFLHGLPVFGTTRNLADIAVLRNRDSLAWLGERTWPAVHAAEEMLLRAGIPYNVLFSEDFDERAAAFRVIILPEVAVLSDADAARIARYVEAGGNILVLGNGGVYTESMRTREDFALKPVTGVSRFQRGTGIHRQAYGKGQSACLALSGSTHERIQNLMSRASTLLFPRWYPERAQILATLDHFLGDRRQVTLASPENTAVSLRTTPDGRTALHLLSYRMHAEPVSVALTLRGDCFSGKDLQWHTPDRPPVTITPEPCGNRAAFTLPDFLDYGVLIG